GRAAAARHPVPQVRLRRHGDGLRCRARPAESRSRPRRNHAPPDIDEALSERDAAPAVTVAGRRECRASTTARLATWCLYAPAAAGCAPAIGRLHLPKMLAPGRKISMLRATIPARGVQSTARPVVDRGIAPVKVIASSLRKGNIVDLDGR